MEFWGKSFESPPNFKESPLGLYSCHLLRSSWLTARSLASILVCPAMAAIIRPVVPDRTSGLEDEPTVFTSWKGCTVVVFGLSVFPRSVSDRKVSKSAAKPRTVRGNTVGYLAKPGLLAIHCCDPIEKPPPKAVRAGYTPNKVVDQAQQGSENRIAKTTNN